MDTTRAPGVRLLYVDPDPTVRQPVAAYLESYGFSVTHAETIEGARVLADRFDVLLMGLDADQPQGLALIKEVAALGRPGIVVTSALSDDADRVLALEAGADHYLTKPVNLRALVAHLRAVCRRTEAQYFAMTRTRVAQFGDWSVDLSAHRASKEGRSVDLTAGEMAILRVLLERPRRVFSRGELIASTRQDDAEVFDRTVDVLISRLRHKLEENPVTPELIQTVRHEGYIFTQHVVWSHLPS